MNENPEVSGSEIEPTPLGAYKKALRRVWHLEDRMSALSRQETDGSREEAHRLLDNLEESKTELERAWSRLVAQEGESEADRFKTALYQERSVEPPFDLAPSQDRDT